MGTLSFSEFGSTEPNPEVEPQAQAFARARYGLLLTARGLPSELRPEVNATPMRASSKNSSTAPRMVRLPGTPRARKLDSKRARRVKNSSITSTDSCR